MLSPFPSEFWKSLINNIAYEIGQTEFQSNRNALASQLPTYSDTFIRSGVRVGGENVPSGRIGGWSYAYIPNQGYVTNSGQFVPLTMYPNPIYLNQPYTPPYQQATKKNDDIPMSSNLYTKPDGKPTSQPTNKNDILFSSSSNHQTPNF